MWKVKDINLLIWVLNYICLNCDYLKVSSGLQVSDTESCKDRLKRLDCYLPGKGYTVQTILGTRDNPGTYRL